jgi:hypothetical protein
MVDLVAAPAVVGVMASLNVKGHDLGAVKPQRFH